MKKSFTQLSLVISLWFLLCFSISCQDKEAMAKLKEFKAQAEVEEQNKAIARQILEGMDKNIDIFDALAAPGCLTYMPGSFNPISLGELKQFVRMAYEAFPDYTHTIEDIIADGDKVAVRCNLKGTHQGEFIGIPPTSAEVKYGEILIFRIKDGKIVEVWVQEDSLWMMQQLGMELKPKEAEK